MSEWVLLMDTDEECNGKNKLIFKVTWLPNIFLVNSENVVTKYAVLLITRERAQWNQRCHPCKPQTPVFLGSGILVYSQEYRNFGVRKLVYSLEWTCIESGSKPNCRYPDGLYIWMCIIAIYTGIPLWNDFMGGTWMTAQSQLFFMDLFPNTFIYLGSEGKKWTGITLVCGEWL